MSKKGIYILIVVVVVLLLVLWAASITPTKKPSEETQTPSETPAAEGPVAPTPEAPTPEEGAAVEPAPVEEPPAPEMVESPLGEFNPETPHQTGPLAEEEVPEEAIKLRATTTGFEPSEFSVKAGSVVSLTVTGVDATHVFKFEDPSLANVAVGVANGETRGISFVAPDKPGDYAFYCDVPGHRARGEEGVMHVTR